jgi:2-polyprenyl-3-methyl-5-hydroxy-6-metoxy-1,4-benzoquinol methylase
MDRFPGLTAYVSGDPVGLPFADDRFEIVLSCGVLEHVQEPAASLAELHRVLQPHGRLLVYKLPNRFSYLEAIARLAGRVGSSIYYHGRHPHDRVYDRDSASALLTAAGFRVDDCRLMNMLPLTVQGGLAWRHTELIWRANVALSRLPFARLLATNLELEATALSVSPEARSERIQGL